MRNRLLRLLKPTGSLTFCIKRETLNSGKVRLTPMVKTNGLFSDWTPIVKVNEKYEAVHFETDLVYTEDVCLKYINAYKKQVDAGRADLIKSIEYSQIDPAAS